MPFDPNDPRLTAYALGELEDESDRRAIEAELSRYPEALAFIEGIKETAALLSSELRQEPTLSLAPAQRLTIEQELQGDEVPATVAFKGKPGGGHSAFRLRMSLAAAAGLLGMVGLTGYAIMNMRQGRPAGQPSATYELAQGERPELPELATNAISVESFDAAPAVASAEAARTADALASMPAPPPAPKLSEFKDSYAFATAPSPAPIALTPPAPASKPGQAGAMPSGGTAGGMMGRSVASRSRPPESVFHSRQSNSNDRAQGQSQPGQPPQTRGMNLGVATANAPQSSGKPMADAPASGPKKSSMGVDVKRHQASESGVLALGMQAPTPATPGLVAASEAKPSDGTKAMLSDLTAAAPAQFGRKGDAKQQGSDPRELQLAENRDAESGQAGQSVPKEAAPLAEKKLEQEGFARKVELQAKEADNVRGEQYAPIVDNPFLPVANNELSTFAIDVDTASYSNVRRFLTQNQRPPKDAVRIEEMLNYFSYNDPAPKDDRPFSVNVEMAASPWNAENRLVRVGLKGKTIDADKRPASNLVFLIDVSGSMSDLNKLPLLKAGMKLLVDQLTENDRVAIVVYASDVRVVLPSTPCHKKKVITDALDSLQSGGSTNGGKGILLAYEQAVQNFIRGGTNRVILATDGDFNVGMEKPELLAQSETRAKSGVFLTVLGFGEGNLQEAFMEQLANKGNGHYAYIDNIQEARKVLVGEMTGTLVTIAKDVKVQVEFNPARVKAYRLIGYENRIMAAQDFRNDKKDAGEIGAGHGVTALYEITPADAKGGPVAGQADRPLKYAAKEAKPQAPAADASPESLTVFLRYKAPDGDVAKEIEQPVVDKGQGFGQASSDLKFAAAVAGFGMLLRDSPYKGSLNFSAVSELAGAASQDDKAGYRAEFVELVKKAQSIYGQ